MRITDVKINGFGVWSGLTVERLADDMTVFYGPNEAGKTTLMQFLRTVLYGFSPERRSRYLPPVNGGQPGGALRVVTPRGPFEIHRRTGAYDSPEALGDLSLMDSHGTPQSPHQLSSLLGGLDEATFNNVFAIGLREMQELSTLNDSAAAEQLYKLTSGLDRVSLIDVMRELSESRIRVLSPDSRPSQLAQLLERRENLQREIEDLAARGRRWPQLAAQRAAMTQDIDKAEDNIAELQKQIQSYELVLQVRDKWLERRRVEEQLAGLGVPVDLPSDALEQIELMNGRLKKLRRRVVACKRQKAEMNGELSKHVVNRNLLVQAARITALCEHGPWIGSLEQEVERLRGEVQTLEREVEARRPQIEMPTDKPKHKLPEISAKTLALLRTPAGRLNQLNKLVERTERDAQNVKVRTDQVMQRMTSELADLDEPSLAAALEKAGTRVAQLRRRIQLEERVDQLSLQKKDLEGQSHELFDSQVMPFERMAWLFGGFALSFLLFFSGCFGGWLWTMPGWIGFLLAIAGFGVLAVSIVTKLEWERESHRRLESSSRQVELIAHQLKEAKEERDELDEHLPSGGGSLDARLAQAERNLQHLETLAPMETQRHETGQHVEVAERRATKAAEDLKEARKNWQNALRSASLPEHLGPNDVRHLARSFKHMAIVRRQLDSRREELESRTRELASLAGRITEVFADVGLKVDIESPQAQLKLLAASLAEQQQVAQRRDTVQQQHRKLRDRWQKLRRSFSRVTRSRRALLARANATDEQELRQMLSRQQQAATLRTQREELGGQVRLIVGDQWSEESLARELLSSNVESPEQRRNRMTARVQEGKVKLSQLHERRGQLAAEMKTLADDRRLPAAKLELGCVDEQVVYAVRRWQVLAVTGLLLESVRGTYESTRQPETLREASQYLQRLTNGQYVRVWTPIEERMLRVDDAKGQVLPLEKLSRGTREAVFLSLRLALASGYARRGITLPFILDDVLVNFDANRVKAAATLLREFARQGHQMLFFTCHEHIMKMLQTERADVRVLPSRNGAGGPVVLQPLTLAELAPVKVEEPRPRRKKIEPMERPIEKPLPVAVQVIALPEEPPVAAVPAPPAVAAPEPPRLVPEPVAARPVVERPEPQVEHHVLQYTRVEASTPPAPSPILPDGSAERRFTWESPEMYWEEDREAVA